MAGRLLSISLGSPVLLVTQLNVVHFTSETVTVRYDSLPANRPLSNENFVAIWASSVIPWQAEPLARITIPQNSESGTVVLSGVSIGRLSYVLGYGTGPNVSNIAASALISASGPEPAPHYIQIAISNVTTNTLSVNYQTLNGYLPHTYGNWVGLWRGYMSPYNPTAPLAKLDIPDDATEGTVAFNGLDLAVNGTYTLAYFTGQPGHPEQRTAAAMLTFTVAE
ncbi:MULTISPECIES: hypothetical protein [Pseudomonas]|uniref:hypothetical protein n=1 Tax=Pseudomonas TaxID=286 RepID=UPI001472AFAF|nr:MULTISPECIES: hypothetical protein [Pseudomonas]NNA55330.1 hypothetical protein [Pseudomonas koreensis]